MRFSRLSFLISRDPPEGGTTSRVFESIYQAKRFLISRDPPEGGTSGKCGTYVYSITWVSNF